MAGNVADEQANLMAILRPHQREVAADGMDSLVERVDVQSIADLGFGYEAFLGDAQRVSRILFDFLLTFLKSLSVFVMQSSSATRRPAPEISVNVTISKVFPDFTKTRELMMTGRRLPSFRGRTKA